MKNECLTAVLEELRKVGAAHAVGRGGKHLCVRFGENLRRRFAVPSTPGDYRSVRNIRAQIRRVLREGRA